jgi:ERF superfamily protein
MIKSDSIKELAAALAEAQADFPAIPRDRTVTVKTKSGATYQFSYAPLDTILANIRPAMKKNGLAFLQSVNGEALTTTLIHKSGEWITSDPLPIKVVEAGSQAMGSAITYAKRYALTALLGIVTEEDDDGAAADGHESKPVEKSRITPNSGAGDDLTAPQKSRCLDVSIVVRDFLAEGKEWNAFEELEHAKLDMGEKLYIWSLFNSKERAAIKRMQAAQNKNDARKEAAQV